MSAKSLFYPKDKTFSTAEEKAFAREELIYNVTEDLLIAMEDADVSKADLARKLSKGRAFVSQILSGQRNMTLGTFSDICFAIGVEPNAVHKNQHSCRLRDKSAVYSGFISTERQKIRCT